jgi:hypothetical protein
MQRGTERRSADGPLRTLARLRTVVACEALTVVASARARLRAGGPVRSAVGGRRCAPTALCCSVPRPAAKLAARAALAPLRQLPRVSSRSALARAAASPALLGAAHSLPGPPARSLAGSGSLCSSAREAPPLPRHEGSALTGRMGAGEQRSAERGSPVYPPGRREAVRWVPRSAAPTAASQPPSRSEQRSAPSLKARVATAKPREGTALGPRANAAHADVRNGPNANASIGRFEYLTSVPARPPRKGTERRLGGSERSDLGAASLRASCTRRSAPGLRGRPCRATP